jgi:hypothetical protein
MKIIEGDKVRSELDGKDCTVTKIVNRMVVLKSRDGEKQIMTGMDTVSMISPLRRLSIYWRNLETRPLPILNGQAAPNLIHFNQV